MATITPLLETPKNLRIKQSIKKYYPETLGLEKSTFSKQPNMNKIQSQIIETMDQKRQICYKNQQTKVDTNQLKQYEEKLKIIMPLRFPLNEAVNIVGGATIS